MMYNGKSRHIQQRHNIVRELLSSGIITGDYVKSKDNVLDSLTKGLSREGVESTSKGMGLRPSTSQHDGSYRFKLWNSQYHTNARILKMSNLELGFYRFGYPFAWRILKRSNLGLEVSLFFWDPILQVWAVMGEEAKLQVHSEGEEAKLQIHGEEGEEVQESEHNDRICSSICAPVNWFKMLAMELHWSFVFGVVIVYGISQGLGGAFSRISTEYYMKDVQKVQPSESQVYSGITSIPWIVKPLWGLLTDAVPILGYHRRPYFLFAGFLGFVSMLFLSLHKNLHIVLALLSLTAGSAAVAIADVTVDACVAQNSGSHPSLAADMQSLCALSSSIGALVGFSLSGILVHLLGPMGVYGLLSIPAGLVVLVGVLLKESQTHNFAYQQVNQNLTDAAKAMWNTLKCPEVWQPCLYMYLSFALSVDIQEGMFFWATDSAGGPQFSKVE
ncbi:putative folate-biopterin transporter 5 [Capsicum baccatum]|uniref:Folate-biopterin transporter 5 n=1 Tax=Capsicum baccatum TaxID=33114 RepID=A0A2G2W4E9_CAPBA|nr:putative folate-biopterin transporter 5 [Capsicum baccatum]